jgi:RNA polymerase sigma-70 factor, ECF subfamily
VALREARSILGDQRAHDAAQEATLRAWRHAHHCRTPERPAPRVRAIARREALRIASGELTAEQLPSLSESDDGRREEVHLRVDVGRALHVLNTAERNAVAGRYWMDLSDSQLASRLEIPLGTAKIRLHRARLKLRAALTEQDD